MSFQWWCAAQGEPWSWSWQAYPGVWAAVVAVLLARRKLARIGSVESAPNTERVKRMAWIAGALVLWAALDWPVGPLGAAYLASVHMAQYLLVGLVVPALFLLGTPSVAWLALEERKRFARVLEDLTNPLAATIVFNVGMTLTHWPGVVDALRVSQIGSFALDALWLACGLVFWWPLVAPVPARPGFHPILRVGYLFVNGVVLTPPALMLLFSRSPLYGVYELAPPILDNPVIWDQQLAGAIMKIGSALIMGSAMVFVVRSWVREERALEAGRSSP